MSTTTTDYHATVKAQAEQIRSVAVPRIGSIVGHLPANLLAKLDDAIRLHLAL